MAEIIDMFDKRARTSPQNGKLGGCPKGYEHPKLQALNPADQTAVIEHAATALLSGKSLNNSLRHLGPVTPPDRAAISRLTGLTADEFTNRLTEKLRHLADLTADRIEEHLKAGNNKLSDLSFLMTVTVDKLDRLGGKQAINNASVNIQVNNYGTTSKEDILARLHGQGLATGALPVAAVVVEQNAPQAPASA